MKKFTMTAMVVLFAAVGLLHGQDNIPRLAALLDGENGPEKLRKEKFYQHVYVPMKMPSAYGIENAFRYKKIGILTCVVIDEKRLVNGSGETIYWRDGETLSKLATALHDGAIADARNNLSAQGITLLTPDEYLTTPEQKEFYQSLKFKNAAIAKVADAMYDVISSKGGAVGSPDAYRIFPELVLSTSAPNKRSEYQIGSLAQKCGLDAMWVIALHVNTVLDKYGHPATLYHHLQIDVHTTNQTPQDPDRKYPKLIGGYPASMKIGRTMAVRGGMPINEHLKEKTPEGKKVVSKEYVGELTRLFAAFLTETGMASAEGVAKTNKKNKFTDAE